ncbi:Aldo/keto reductase [Lipomyces doorenjongii]
MSELHKSGIKVVFGAMTIGKPGSVRFELKRDIPSNQMLDVFQKHDHSEVDTARVYGQGSSEEYLATAEWQKRGITMDTKLYPTADRGTSLGREVYSHKPEDLRRGLMSSLEVDKLYKEGYFDRFGISNYMSWEVAQICEICERNGWIKPSVYQGVYHALQRSIELELFPCLRHYGICLYAFQPLAGGFLSDRYYRDTKSFEDGSRFDPKRWQGVLHRDRYWNDLYFDALDIIRSNHLTEADCALRWCNVHHTVKGVGTNGK